MLPWFACQKQLQSIPEQPLAFSGSCEAQICAPFNQQKYCVNRHITSHHETQFYNDWSRNWHERIFSSLDLIHPNSPSRIRLSFFLLCESKIFRNPQVVEKTTAYSSGSWAPTAIGQWWWWPWRAAAIAHDEVGG